MQLTVSIISVLHSGECARIHHETSFRLKKTKADLLIVMS